MTSSFHTLLYNLRYFFLYFQAHLKRMEGVGELSLCKVCCSGNLQTSVSDSSTLAGDIRSHLIVSSEEGDVIFADICAR